MATETFYLKHNIWYFKKVSASTNYATDTLVPVGSVVSITDEDDDELELKSEAAGATFTVKLVNKHTKGLTIAEVKERLLSKTPVDIPSSPAEIANAIKSGTVVVGMTKAQALMARGYPPKVATESTEENHWTYWQTKWNRQIISFTDGKVSAVKD